MSRLGRRQSRTQSPQALWPAVGRQERLWRIRKKLNFLIGCSVYAPSRLPLFYRRNPAVIKFQYPRVSPGAHPLTKRPEDSGYEIGKKEVREPLSPVFPFSVTFSRSLPPPLPLPPRLPCYTGYKSSNNNRPFSKMAATDLNKLKLN